MARNQRRSKAETITEGQARDQEGDAKRQLLFTLEDIERTVAKQHKSTAEQLQIVLDGMAGQSFGSFDGNREIAQRIQSLLQQLNVRVKCPKTGLPGNLRHRQSGRARHGAFLIEVTQNGRRLCPSSSTTLPELVLVPAPEDRRKKTS